MTNNSLISFDPICPLMGHRDRSGFLLKTDRLDFKDVLNFLCDNFGEGNQDDYCYFNDNWSLREGHRYVPDYEKVKPQGINLVAFNKTIIDAIFEKFNIDIPLDNSNSIEYYINEAIAPLLFSKLTTKRDRKLRNLIADKLNMLGHKIQWYDINYNWDTQMVSFNVKNTDVNVRLCC